MDLDGFVKTFMDTRLTYWKRKVKAEKMKELIKQQPLTSVSPYPHSASDPTFPSYTGQTPYPSNTTPLHSLPPTRPAPYQAGPGARRSLPNASIPYPPQSTPPYGSVQPHQNTPPYGSVQNTPPYASVQNTPPYSSVRPSQPQYTMPMPSYSPRGSPGQPGLPPTSYANQTRGYPPTSYANQTRGYPPPSNPRPPQPGYSPHSSYRPPAGNHPPHYGGFSYNQPPPRKY